MSDTNPLPAAQLLALADELANAVGSHVICDAWLEGSHMERTLEAYRAARAASPVTLEEALMDHLIVLEKSNDTEDRIAAMGAIITHGRVINARRLAGGGGAA